MFRTLLLLIVNFFGVRSASVLRLSPDDTDLSIKLRVLEQLARNPLANIADVEAQISPFSHRDSQRIMAAYLEVLGQPLQVHMSLVSIEASGLLIQTNIEALASSILKSSPYSGIIGDFRAFAAWIIHCVRPLRALQVGQPAPCALRGVEMVMSDATAASFLTTELSRVRKIVGLDQDFITLPRESVFKPPCGSTNTESLVLACLSEDINATDETILSVATREGIRSYPDEVNRIRDTLLWETAQPPQFLSALLQLCDEGATDFLNPYTIERVRAVLPPLQMYGIPGILEGIVRDWMRLLTVHMETGNVSRLDFAMRGRQVVLSERAAKIVYREALGVSPQPEELGIAAESLLALADS